jgi:PAS domain S-box-containing protein
MKVSPIEIGHGWTRTEERLVIDTTPALIHTALPDGNINFFNRRWLEYLGLTLEDVQGWRWTAVIHPEDVAGIVDKWRTSLVTGEPFEAETRVRRADGEYRWFLHRKIALRDKCGKVVKWYGSSIDIEDRRQAEDALRRSEAYLAEAQRLSHTGSFGWNIPPEKSSGPKRPIASPDMIGRLSPAWIWCSSEFIPTISPSSGKRLIARLRRGPTWTSSIVCSFRMVPPSMFT